jgi:LL-diaminopimelate aminotransferase
MAGVRVGFAVGARSLIDALAAYRTNVGYGAPWVAQYGAAHAFDNYEELSAPVVATYRARRDAITSVMRRLGEHTEPPRGAMYLWHPVPKGVDDWSFVHAMIADAQVGVAPGSAFGPGGTGYFRLSYVAEPHVLESAMERIGAARTARGWR